MATLYNWHPITKRFIGTSIADESPLEPGVYLVPGYSTLAPIPDTIPENMVCIWNEMEWILVDRPIPVEEPKNDPAPVEPIDPWIILREDRNQKLFMTDFMFTRDYILPEDLDIEWREYRTLLRNLPDTTEDPTNVTWPSPPSDPKIIGINN